MAQFSVWKALIRTALASVLAMSVTTPDEADAQSEASKAYSAAVEQGTIEALERFIERYPLSPEANDAFRDIVTLSRGSTLSGRGPSGLFTDGNTNTSANRGIEIY